MISNKSITPSDLTADLERFWKVSGQKIELINREYDDSQGSPVFTVAGKYSTRGWTEWTQGFQYGSEILQFDATGDESFLAMGKQNTVQKMAPHVTPENEWERNFYVMALRASSAVQAKRWTTLPSGGYIYSFNGPHSLFADTIRSLRALAVGHQLGHAIMDEGDKKTSLLERLVQHAKTTADYAVYYGEGRDFYDVLGRTAHESIFNLNDGAYRCPNSQQGFSPFTTWTRGLAWVMVGAPEQLEFLKTIDDAELEPLGGRELIEGFLLKMAKATCDFYIENTPTDGVPYWDTGALHSHKLGDDVYDRESDPFNNAEPIDSSADKPV